MHAMTNPYLAPVTPSTHLKPGDLIFFPYAAEGPYVASVLVSSPALSAALGSTTGELIAGG